MKGDVSLAELETDCEVETMKQSSEHFQQGASGTSHGKHKFRSSFIFLSLDGQAMCEYTDAFMCLEM